MIEKILSQQLLFSLKELQDIGFIKVSTAKKLIYSGKLAAIKVGNKLFITRDEIFSYLENNKVKIGGQNEL